MTREWNEALHRRDELGRFTETTMEAWAAKVAEQMAGARRHPDPVAAFAAGDRPPGFQEARERHRELNQAYLDRELSGEELRELKALDAAFDKLREMAGRPYGQRFDVYGEARARNVEPAASRLGYRRVGDHPERLGAADGPGNAYIPRSSHPLAGGLWIDPDHPGTRHAPAYRNDAGHFVGALQPLKHRTVRRKEAVQSRRTEDWTHTPGDKERVPASDGGKIGYREGQSAAFVLYMKRQRARSRAENPNRDQWVLRVNDHIEQRGRHG